jgi:multidrug efflux pump subunit AcrA (membrane-fusion protein)
VLDEGTGEPAPVEVELGLRQDGRVEITGGLEEGQEILEFVPGVDAPNQDEGMVW